MKIEDLFRIGKKTVFTGKLDTNSKVVADAFCIIEVDGTPVGELRIDGEVHTGKPHRDLWTATPVSLTRETLRDHDVWLISEHSA